MIKRVAGSRLISFLLIVGAAACNDPTGTERQLYVTGGKSGRIRVALGTSPARWTADPLVIDSARVAHDTLYVSVQHGGGCATHEYLAVAWNGWLESHPVQVGVLLAHEDNGDMCDAIMQANLRFDLTPLRDAYRASYGSGPATLVINLNAASALTSSARRLEYMF
jgi:hypothetical protein